MSNENSTEVTVSNKPPAEAVDQPRSSTGMFGPLDEVERLFDRLMPRTWMRPMNWNWPMWGGLEESLETIRKPQLNIIDRDKDILIRAEMPGVQKKDIDISVTNSALNIRGNVSQETKEQKDDYFRCEIIHGNFFRSLSLPDGIDSSRITASHKDGILEITLPKEESAQRRSVEVK